MGDPAYYSGRPPLGSQLVGGTTMTTYVRAQHSRGHKARYGFPAGPDSFSSPAPRTASQAPTPGPEQLHLGICAKEYARPRLQAPLSPQPRQPHSDR